MSETTMAKPDGTGKAHRPAVEDYPYEPPWTACGRITAMPDGSIVMVPMRTQPAIEDQCRTCWPARRMS